MRRPADCGVVVVAALFVLVVAVAAAPLSRDVRLTDRSPDVTAANHRAWGSVSIVDGLPSDAVNAICQASDGAIWFATDRGLAVQDGRGTRLVGLGSSEPQRVSALASLADGRILAATDAGLLRIEHESAAPYLSGSPSPICAVATHGAGVSTIAAAAESGRLFIDTPSIGPVTIESTSPDSPADARQAGMPPDIAAIVARNGTFLVANRRCGLLRVADGGVLPAVRGLPTSVSALAVDSSDGSLWIGVANGSRQGSVYRLDGSDRLTTISTDIGAVTGLTVSDPGTCWVATAASGAYLVSSTGIERHETFASTIGGLRSNTLRCAFTDREGVVWFGGDRGASRFDTRGSESRLVGPDANGDVVRSISRTAGRLWIGTNRGLAAGASAATLAPVASLEGRTVFDVESAPDGRLIVATQQGVFAAEATVRGSPVFEPVTTAEGDVDMRARAIAVMGGTAYIGTFGAGLLRLDGDALRGVDFVGAGDRLRDIVCLHADSTEAMWIGTAGRGVFRCDRAGLTPLESEALGGQTVYEIAGSESSTLWFATNSGLVVRDGSTEGRILEDCDVRAVVPIGPRSALCATANRGAVLVGWDDRFGWLESRIDEERGLPSDITFAVDVAPIADGHSVDALIGTSRGLTAYRTSSAPPVVGVAGALASRLLTSAEIDSVIVLAYPQRSVVLELFATSTRTFRGQFQYGFDVTDAGGAPVTHGLARDGKVSLDRLTPGSYRIDVVAFDNDLVASAVRSVRVTVERAPFPWTTAGLTALLLIAMLVLVWGARQNRTIARTNAALRTANTDLADARAEVARETERERSRIARDLHDQTLADLRRLMLLADKLPAPVSDVSPRPGELRQRISEVSGEIRRICEDLSPSALSNLGLGPALEWLVTQAQAELPSDQRFTSTVTFSDRLEERFEPGSDLPIQIYRIVQEAVSNICRHSKATHVEVDARVDEAGDMTIRIRDDGVGFDECAEPDGSGRGLGNMRWRADMIHASIEWTRPPGGGTEVTLRRPDESRSAGTSDLES